MLNKSFYKESKRQSNFELLRIVAILMIIVSHIVRHSVVFQLTDTTSIHRFDNGFFCIPVFSYKLVVIDFLNLIGKIGNGLFLMISGYFLIQKTIDINRVIFKLVSQMVFCFVMLVLFSIVCIKLWHADQLGVPTYAWFNSIWWFPGYYLTIVIVFGILVKKRIEKLTPKAYLSVLMVLFVIFSLSYPAGLLSDISARLRTLAAGLFFFGVGGYVRLYNPFKKIRGYILIAFVICITGFFVLNGYTTACNMINNYNYNADFSKLFIPATTNFPDYNFYVVAYSLVIFEITRRMTIKPSMTINYAASASFIIYLVHDNDFARWLMRRVDWVTLLASGMRGFICKMIGCTIVIYTIGLICYSIFCLLSRIILSDQIRRVILDEENNTEQSQF